MAGCEPRLLWIYSRNGVFRFCTEEKWARLYSKVLDTGWEPPSTAETMWMESPLIRYRPGSFFTREDASSFVLALEDAQTELSSAFPRDLLSLVRGVVELFKTGTVFIWPDPPHKTAGTDSFEVVHVYLCPRCGFMHHGNWYFSTAGSGQETARSSVESILKYKYCPLCSSTDVRTAAFVLPQLDPDEISELCDPGTA